MSEMFKLPEERVETLYFESDNPAFDALEKQQKRLLRALETRNDKEMTGGIKLEEGLLKATLNAIKASARSSRKQMQADFKIAFAKEGKEGKGVGKKWFMEKWKLFFKELSVTSDDVWKYGIKGSKRQLQKTVSEFTSVDFPGSPSKKIKVKLMDEDFFGGDLNIGLDGKAKFQGHYAFENQRGDSLAYAITEEEQSLGLSLKREIRNFTFSFGIDITQPKNGENEYRAGIKIE